MTRRDQSARAWIKRSGPGSIWFSHVSLRGTTHRLATNTRIRKAAIEFNLLHLSQLLRQKN